MDITQLRYFLKTAELLNYSRAAEALFITRQSLRHAIAALEEEVGSPLFYNERNKIGLTEHGYFLAGSAAPVVASFDRLTSDMHKLKGNRLHLTVAVSESLFPFILPGKNELLRAFQTMFPNIGITVMTMDADSVLDAVIKGSADCGCVLQMPYDRPGMRFHVFQTFEAAVTHKDRFNGRKVITWKDLLPYHCIGMGSPENFLHALIRECSEQHCTLDYTVVSSALDAYYLIEHGDAVGFDIMVTEGQKNDSQHFALLEGYRFAFGMLYQENPANATLIALFGNMIERNYLKYSGSASM